MNDPVLDQMRDIDSPPEPSWGTTALWVFLLLTGANVLVSLGVSLFFPYYLKQVQEGVRTAGDVIAIVNMIVMAGYLLSAFIIGIWWGRSLAKNLELPGWQILLLAFGLALLSLIIRNLAIGFRFQPENTHLVLPYLLFVAVFQSTTFASIVFATATFRRGKGYLPGFLALGFATLLIIMAYIAKQ
jgi:hypothetical protein